jgi:hypothetical protein
MKLNLAQSIYLALAMVFMLIGVHQTIYYGFGPSYWLFMMSIVFLMLLRFNRAKQRIKLPKTPDKPPVKVKTKKKR